IVSIDFNNFINTPNIKTQFKEMMQQLFSKGHIFSIRTIDHFNKWQLELETQQQTDYSWIIYSEITTKSFNYGSLRELDLQSSHTLSQVKQLYKFPDLQLLNLSHCIRLKSLEGVSSLTKLEKLNCLYCNSLQSIAPLTGCTNLKCLKLA